MLIRGKDIDGRIFFRDLFGLRRQLRRIRREAVGHEFLRVVEDDEVAAGLHILVEQPLVVRLQVLAHGVRTSASHDRVEALEVAHRQLVLAEQRDRVTKLRDAGRHLVADAHDVADGEPGNGHDVDAAHVAHRRPVQVPRLEIAMVEQIVALDIFTTARAGDRRYLVRAVLEHRNGDDKMMNGAFARVREREGVSGRLGCPPRWQPQRERSAGAALDVVHQFHLQIDFLHRCREGNDGARRRHGQRQRWNEAQLAHLVAIRQLRLTTPDDLARLHCDACHLVFRYRDRRRSRVRTAELRGIVHSVAVVRNRRADEIRSRR